MRNFLKSFHNLFPYRDSFKQGGKYHVVCYKDASRKEILWEEDAINKVTNQGLDYANNVTLFTTSKLSNAWYLTLVVSNTTPASGMTYATPTYTESVAFSARPACTFAASSSQVVTNVASPGSFTNTGTTETIYGISLVGANASAVTTPGNTNATGGVLFSFGLLGSPQPWATGNVINVTYQVTASSLT